MKSAYLNAVIAELKRKKISRETGVTSNATKDQHHQQRTRHPSSAQLLQPTTLHPTAGTNNHSKRNLMVLLNSQITLLFMRFINEDLDVNAFCIIVIIINIVDIINTRAFL